MHARRAGPRDCTHVDGAFISIEFKLRDERFATYRDE